jgi:hypothetical protein
MATRRADPRVVLAMVLVQAVVGTITVRDLNRRTADQVRGPRVLWKLWGGTNTVGALVYWLFGRKRTS